MPRKLLVLESTDLIVGTIASHEGETADIIIGDHGEILKDREGDALEFLASTFNRVAHLNSD